MNRQSGNVVLVAGSITLILLAVAIFLLELVAYSRQRERMPAGLSIAGVPVGGLTRGAALQQVVGAYAAPIEVHYGAGGVIGLDPASISFRLDTDSMLAVAETYRTEASFWTGFWAFLWNQPGETAAVPLKAEYSESQLRGLLAEIAVVYDEPPSPPVVDSGALGFSASSAGRALDIEASLPLIDQALRSPTHRRAALVLNQGSTARPTFDQLQQLITSLIAAREFDGLASLVVVDLQTGEELGLNTFNGERLPTDPNIAFSGMSIMKVPIVVTTFRAWDAPPDLQTTRRITETIELSGNDAANSLLSELGDGDPDAGLQRLTDDLRALGLTSTFMVGTYHDLRAPAPPRTPANSRADISARPDGYMQTTATEMGALWVNLYQCAQTIDLSLNRGGAFQTVWPGQLTAVECRTMLDYFTQNKIGVLIEAGVPEGTRVAHKHGWIGDTNGDCGIVFSPGADYVLCMFLWRPDYLAWDVSSPLMAEMSRAVYSYFNP